MPKLSRDYVMSCADLKEFVIKESLKRNKSLHQISKDINLSYSTLNSLDRSKPYPKTLNTLALFFNADVIDLYDLQNKK